MPNEVPEEIPTERGEKTPSLKIRGLTYTFGVTENGIQDADLDVVSGGLTVITRGMGSGKTTLLRSILGLLPAQSGEVWWDDELVLDLAEDQILNTVQDSVLESDIRSMDAGLNTWVGPRGLRLSGGQVQRTAIARTLVRETNLLVLDDLSSALDVTVEQRLINHLLNGKRRILAVSHRPRVLERADHVVLVQGGWGVAQGDLKMLLASNEEMRRL